jgi:hypothetical protein
MATIDLNSDVGESYGRWTLGDDTAMFRSVSSANVACGFHAGDPSVIRKTCREAVAAGVVIGAHVGYRDLAGFGRRFWTSTRSNWRTTSSTRSGHCRPSPPRKAARSPTSSRTAASTTRSWRTPRRRKPSSTP